MNKANLIKCCDLDLLPVKLAEMMHGLSMHQVEQVIEETIALLASTHKVNVQSAIFQEKRAEIAGRSTCESRVFELPMDCENCPVRKD